MNGYGWSSNSANNKGIRWVAWEKMCMAKGKGGMGFRSLRDFNLALLGKHCWKLANDSNSPVAGMFKSRYYPKYHFMNSKCGGGASFIWAGIWKAK